MSRTMLDMAGQDRTNRSIFGRLNKSSQKKIEIDAEIAQARQEKI